MELKKGMSLMDLIELAKTSPEHKNLYMGLAMIDNTTNNFVKAIVESLVDNVNHYYVKTEIQNQCYSVMLYNTDRAATVGYSWPMANFLEMCSKQTLEMEMNIRVKQMIDKFNDKKLSTTKINWII
jgi:hypothetical protein